MPAVAKRSWWLLFPFQGLSITDHDPGLDKPLFGDASIISRDAANIIVSQADATRNRLSPNRPNLITNMYRETIEHLDDFPSYIAVRRTGVLSIESEQADATKATIREAAERAYEVSALLSLGILAHWRYPQTCGLLEQTSRWVQHLIAVDAASGNFYGGGSARSRITIMHGASSLTWSRDKLREVLYQPKLADFASAFQPRAKPSGLMENVRRAAVRLSGSVHSVDPESQVLGAVTALELLVDTGGIGQKGLERRLFALLGTVSEMVYHAHVVLDTRNKYVHQAKRVSDEQVAQDALYLGLATLLRFSSVCKRFEDREEIGAYLDFVASGIEMLSLWSKAEKKRFFDILKHKPDELAFPWN